MKPLNSFSSIVLLLFSAALPFCGCGDSDRVKKINLLAGAAPDKSGAASENQKEAALRISVASILSPKSSFAAYAELAQYFEKRLGMPVQVSFGKNYAETNDSLRESESDIAFICTGGYLAAGEYFPLDVLAVPVVKGRTVYNSLIVARKNDSARGFAGLKGRVFAFTDEFSLTGRIYARARLKELNQTSGFFGGMVFTGSHDNSIKAVAEGFADAACVSSLVYQALLERRDLYAAKLKILETSPPFGNPPVVARAGLSPEIKNRARDALLDMHRDREGAVLLGALSVERFVAPPADLYSSSGELVKKALAREDGGR